MLEIEQLEKEWRIYKLKRTMPYLLATILAGSALVSTLFWPEIRTFLSNATSSKSFQTHQTHKTSTPPTSVPPKKSIPSTPVKEEKSSVAENSVENTVKPETAQPPVKQVSVEQKTEQKKQLPEQNEGKTVILNPDTAFLKTFKENVQNSPSEKKTVTPVTHEVIRTVKEKEPPIRKDVKPKLTEIEKEEQIATNEVSPSMPEKKSSLVIQTKQTNNTLDYLIERFNQNRDPKLATYIAQSFFKKGNYKETVRWSIVANSLDPSSEESWMLFAKAKVKLGQKEDAVNALRIYLNQYSSKKVKSYLESLESGF